MAQGGAHTHVVFAEEEREKKGVMLSSLPPITHTHTHCILPWRKNVSSSEGGMLPPIPKRTHKHLDTHTHSLSLTHTHTHTHARTEEEREQKGVMLGSCLLCFGLCFPPAWLAVAFMPCCFPGRRMRWVHGV